MRLKIHLKIHLKIPLKIQQKRILIAVFPVVALLVAALLGASSRSSIGPKPGGILTVGRLSDSITLDPANATDAESFKVTRQIFENLVQYNATTTQVVPGLAARWETSRDGLTWLFHLRHGIYFHDGAPLDAPAVVANFRRWMNQDDPSHLGDFEYWGYMFGGFPGLVRAVEAVAPDTVKLTLRFPYAPLLSTLAMPPFGIASPAAFQKYGIDFGRHPVGTGPFALEKWLPGERIILQANPNYRGTRYPGRVIFEVVGDPSRLFQEFRAGNLDIIENLTPEQAAIVKQDPGLNLYLRQGVNLAFLSLNTTRKPLDNVLVRQAINLAINKARLATEIYGGLAEPADGPLPQSVWGRVPGNPGSPLRSREASSSSGSDLPAARTLLKKAGYENGFAVTLWVMPLPRPYLPRPLAAAEAIRADLAGLGISVRIQELDWADFLQKTSQGEHEMALMGWTGENGDPDNFIHALLDPTNIGGGTFGNTMFYRNPKLHSLLMQARSMTGEAARSRLYQKAQAIIQADAPWAPLVHTTPAVATNHAVKGYVPHPCGYDNLAGVWLKR
ncbi:MAG: ABC transporter substrate-binding protein [Firmicutes bacterium]|nr:ABC transporter substrate-binding protein [Bacillota bacterium]